MRRLLAAALGAALIALSGCGGTTPHAVKLPVTASRCAPADTTLGCNLPATRLGLTLSTAPAVAHGVDFGWGAASVATMRANGWSFGASYLSFDPSKDWQHSQVAAYAAAGIARVFVWETSATRALDGCMAGRIDARNALAEAATFGFRAIYFAVDFELQPPQDQAVAGYFRCIVGQIGVDHTGAYGGIATVSLLFNLHLIRYGWQTYAWSGGRWDRRAQLQQYLNGSSVDYDRAVAKDYGQVPYTATRPISHKDRVARIRTLRRVLVSYGCRRRHREHQHLGPRCLRWYHEGQVLEGHR